jgi:hypothetical protein
VQKKEENAFDFYHLAAESSAHVIGGGVRQKLKARAMSKK